MRGEEGVRERGGQLCVQRRVKWGGVRSVGDGGCVCV